MSLPVGIRAILIFGILVFPITARTKTIYFVFKINFASILGYFSFQPVLHDWCNKGRGMCYPVCGMMHIKEPLLLIGTSSLYLNLNCPLPYV